MLRFVLSLIAAFSLFTPLLITGCQMGSEEMIEEHDHGDHKGDHDGHDL